MAATGAGNEQPSPELFGEAARGGLTTINALVLLACTLSNAGLSLYADLSRGAAPQFAGAMALVGWVATLALALVLAGRSAGARGLVPALGKGVHLLRGRPRFACLVVLISGGAAFTVWSRAVSDDGGLLRRMEPKLQAVQQDTTVIREAVTRQVPPAERLARLGFTLAKEDICRAVRDGNLDAWTLMQQVGLPAQPVTVAVGGGQRSTCIEEPLLQPGRASRMPRILKQLPNAGGELDQLYLSQTVGPGHEGPMDVMATSHAARAPRPRGVGYVFAPLLVYAVWGGDADSVAALLAAGANPNIPARIEVMATSRYALEVSPLTEAQRLGHTAMADALRAAGGRAAVAQKSSMFSVSRPKSTTQGPW